jgi:hypothetical protein
MTFQEQVTDPAETLLFTQPRILRPLIRKVTFPAIAVVAATIESVRPLLTAPPAIDNEICVDPETTVIARADEVAFW